MNSSGLAVVELIKWYRLASKRLIVVYDDVDLEVGELRLRLGGSSAGHKGVESIINAIDTQEFIRVRIGIGRKSLTGDVTDYVLEKIPPSQKPVLDEAILNAADATASIVTEGLDTAMHKFHSKSS